MTDQSTLQLVCPQCHVINRLPTKKLVDQPICGKCKGRLVSNQPIAATDHNLSRFIQHSELPVIVDFWAPWCGPCLQFAPTFSEVAAEMATQAIFIKLDTQANPNLSAQHQIRSIPTLAIFKRGGESARLAGALPKVQFKQWLTQHI